MCPQCEKATLARTDDHEWSCFSCGFSETRTSGSALRAARDR